MIRLANLSYTYPGAKTKSLDNIDFTVRPGECVLVTGQSGCGKTTLTRVINGLCPKFYEGTLKGSYQLHGKSGAEIPLDEIALTVGSVFQDPRSQFFCKKVRDEIVLAMENNQVSRPVMQEKLWDVSELLGITNLHDRQMRNLSSGEKQKVAIASVCAMSPKVLVLDEPSANLDTNAIHQLGNFIAELKRQGCAIVISEHRLHYLKDVFDRLLVMEEGKMQHEYSHAQALSLSSEQMEAMGLRLFDAPEFSAKKAISDYPDVVLYANQIGLRIGDTGILQNVKLGLTSGNVVAITGSNGAGKTSLCRILTGIQKESAGAVYINGTISRKKKRITNSFFVQQEVDYQLYMPSVEEEICLGTRYNKQDEAVRKLAEELGLSPFMGRHPNTLSGGQKQRVLIAASILRNAPILVLDEPTSGLDGYHMRAVSSILKDVVGGGEKCVALVTHDLEFINRVASSIVYMNKCEIDYHYEV